MIFDVQEMLKELRIRRSQFMKDARIKECFHFNKDECNKKIISAHSLQRNGVLSILEHKIKGNNVVYSFLHLIPYGIRWYGFEPIGKKSASTFHGFCGYHDTELFKEIENNGIDIDNDEHCFLLSYRSFAKEFHSKCETNKGFGTNDFYTHPDNSELQSGNMSGSNLAIRDLNIVKEKLNNLLKKNEFDGLEYFIYSIDRTIPIAAASSITPAFSLDGTLLNKSESEEDVYQSLIVTVVPTEKETHVIFAFFPEDERSVKYIDDIEELNYSTLEQVITSILIGEIENTFISPRLWQRMTKKERDQLMDGLSITMPQFAGLQRNMFITPLNLFKRKYAI
jgi:hypothetical protein